MVRPAHCAALALAFVLGAAAQGADAQETSQAPVPPAADGGVHDPFEKANRAAFLVGGALDVALVRPVSVFYAHAAPRPAREGLGNVVANLGEPVVIVNRVLQLRPAAAAKSFGRFAVNSTFGLAGVFDVAKGAGLPASPTDFGETLGRYGAPLGPYVFVPVLGPTTLRGAVGRVADIFTDPFTYLRFTGEIGIAVGRPVITGLDDRIAADPQLKEIQKRATDPYAAIRSAFLQNAAFERNGGKVDVKDLPDFTPPPGSPPPSQSQAAPQ